MCYLCLKDNPFNVLDDFAKSDNSKAEQLKRRAALTKAILRVIKEDEDDGWSRCHIGDGLVERLKEEQYRLAKQL